MNFAIVRYLIGWMLGIESIFLLLPALTAVIYGEPELPAYLIAAAISLAGAALLCHRKPKNTRFYAREGYVTVALCWLILAVIGALPFVLSREIRFSSTRSSRRFPASPRPAQPFSATSRRSATPPCSGAA